MLGWLVQACTIDWQFEASEMFHVHAPRVLPKRALPDNLPDLNQPPSYVLRGQLAIAVAYKTEQAWKRKQRKIEDLLGDDIETNKQTIAPARLQFQLFRLGGCHKTRSEHSAIR